MTEGVGVRFKKAGKVYYFDPDDKKLEPEAMVVVETSRGIELGECSTGNIFVEDEKVVQPLRKVLRIATEDDLRIYRENAEKEKQALEICQKKADEHNLEMKVVDVEYSFDGSKILFYFTADGRVDFRELVKDLASIFRVRIELRQIGVRDEAKMLGGLGICGRPFCCATFLNEFSPVSIKMAKEQNLSLSPTKISGTCGRLMCCLRHEQEAYTRLLETTPKVGSIVETPDGEGTVIEVNLLRQKLKILLTDENETVAKVYPVKDVKLIKSGKIQLKQVEEVEPDLIELEE